MKSFVLALGIAALLTASSALADDAKKTTNPAAATAAPAAAAAPATSATAAPAAAAPTGAREHKVYAPADLKWSDAPAALPKGAKAVALLGDPAAPGLFTLRIQLPAGYKIPPHSHPADEHVTVISGKFHIAPGDAFDDKKGHELEEGSFTVMPAGVTHYAWVTEDTVVQLHGMGPWGINYVRPEDDPRNAKQATK